ncbi:NADH-quinone oxidoreductase subunit J family protein [Amycolatopsis sp. H20-H5]|uniref:NADH-quinone oxidoreductase subunit J family protein n=1 Tax=Amycolatopsis sp. H20-H5 TaxID=3046309 RepID=UPI002DB6DD04|nr:NADH-quinone oxidoreductase subunit J [Amycolatopsis sp. H20-H5]MEC3974409.1 NADH-quinone oxidoreductase subunit J [Amycolatopsis sp. H20-H5]
MGSAIFFVLAPVAVLAGVLVFRVDSMVRATFLLLVSFLGVAGLAFLLNSGFVGGIMLLMMTGEMVIMVVFMIMFMMNPGGLMPMKMVHNQRFSACAAVLTFLGLAIVILTVRWPAPKGVAPADVTLSIGEGMMGSKMLVFLTAGVALLACMIAALALATHRGRYDRYGDDLDRKTPDDAARGGVGR